jgi:hypothetical protein
MLELFRSRAVPGEGEVNVNPNALGALARRLVAIRADTACGLIVAENTVECGTAG